MQPDSSTAILNSLHITADSIIRARIKHGITDRVMTVISVKGHFFGLICQRKVHQTVHNHEIELFIASFYCQLRSFLYNQGNTGCFNQAFPLTDKQALLCNRINAGQLIC